MKILRINANRPWNGKKLECRCGCAFKLDNGDPVKSVPDQRDGDYYTVKCPKPECGADVSFTL